MVVGRDLSKEGIKLNLYIQEDLDVWANGICLQQVFMNLILNARQAMISQGRKGGILAIFAEQVDDSVEITVSDTGCGIEACDIRKIFDAFYTTKSRNSAAPQSGSGLGLAFCKRIIDEHNGMISVESKLGVGTTFKIILQGH